MILEPDDFLKLALIVIVIAVLIVIVLPYLSGKGRRWAETGWDRAAWDPVGSSDGNLPN
jgi:hypothetical protein